MRALTLLYPSRVDSYATQRRPACRYRGRSFDGSLEDVIAGSASGDAEQLRATIRHLADLFLDSALAAGVDVGFNNQDGD